MTVHRKIMTENPANNADFINNIRDPRREQTERPFGVIQLDQFFVGISDEGKRKFVFNTESHVGICGIVADADEDRVICIQPAIVCLLYTSPSPRD